MADPEDGWVTVAKVADVPEGSMKRIELPGREIAIARLGGQYFAVDDRCGHMNAPFSRGVLRSTQRGPVVTCPLHFSTFDVSTGKNLTGPVKPAPIDMAGTPKPVLETLAKAGELAAAIRVHDVATYPVRTVGDQIQIRL